VGKVKVKEFYNFVLHIRDGFRFSSVTT